MSSLPAGAIQAVAPAPATIGELSPTARAAVVFTVMPDGAVIYSTETEHYFGLNRTGACIWEHLYPKCETVSEICAALGAAFPGGQAKQIRGDVERLLARLMEQRLIDPRSAS